MKKSTSRKTESNGQAKLCLDPDISPIDATGLSYEVIDVTPAMAQRWLDKMGENRTVNWKTVEAEANDMRAGQWWLSPQPIILGKDDILVDGQHRSHAVVISGVTVRMVVCHCPYATFRDPIDRGRPRSIACIIGKRASDVACLNVLRMLEDGCESSVPLTLSQANEIAERHAQWLDAMQVVPRKITLSGPVFAACVWTLPLDREKTLAFAHKVATGEMIAKGDPAFAFRWWKERNARQRTWVVALAALNCLRHHIHDLRLSAVYTGETGYRAVCARRRALKVANTPAPSIVPATNWKPTMAEGDAH